MTKCLGRAISPCSLLGYPYGGSPIVNLGGGMLYYPTAGSYLLGSMSLSFLITLASKLLMAKEDAKLTNKKGSKNMVADHHSG